MNNSNYLDNTKKNNFKFEKEFKNNKNFLKDLDNLDINYWFDNISHWTIEQSAFLLSGYHPIMPYDEYSSYRIPYEVKKYLITLINNILSSKYFIKKYNIGNSVNDIKSLYVNKKDILSMIIENDDYFYQVPLHKSVSFSHDFLKSYTDSFNV